MEQLWFVITLTACIAAIVKALFSLKSNNQPNLPPGPWAVPIISRVMWMRKTLTDIKAYLTTIYPKFGPIVTLRIGSRPAIFISSRTLAHNALVQKGTIFADRPKPLVSDTMLASIQHHISFFNYGPKWRILRRNLTTEILNPSKAKEFSDARKWVLDFLLDSIRANISSNNNDNNETTSSNIKVVDHLSFATFSLAVFMCFGEKLDEAKIREIESIQLWKNTEFGNFQILFWPSLTKIFLRRHWKNLFDMWKTQQGVMVPLIRAREQLHEHRSATRPNDESSSSTRLKTSYVDTLLRLGCLGDDNDDNSISSNKIKLSEQDVVALCSEFLNAGSDTTSTAMLWIMANLIKFPDIQTKLYQEIKDIIGEDGKQVKEEDIRKMPYLKSVILEGLRRHPPLSFLLPHAVTHDTEFGKYMIPKEAVVSFAVVEIGRDPDVWEDPMQFKPERFLPTPQEFDITGSRGIKMMPFGAGRRICPAYGLVMLNLEYYVANLVWSFEWKPIDGCDQVDLAEVSGFSLSMKHELYARVCPRQHI